MKRILQLVFICCFTLAKAQTPIYQFDFDGNMSNSGTSTNFTGWTSSGTGSVSYTTNRLGVANKAITIPNTVNFSALCSDIPGVNTARTLVFWAKFVNDTDNKTYPVVGWGNNMANQAFGFWRNGVQNSYYTWGAGNDYNVPLTNSQIQNNNNGWVQVAITHTGSTLTTYLNGVDLGNYPRTLNTGGATLYLNRLVNSSGGTGDAVQVDDLKIYNTALTATQIQTLYNPGSSATLPIISGVYSSSSPTQSDNTVFFTLNPGGATTNTNIVVTAFGDGMGAVYPGPTASGTSLQTLSYTISGLTPGTCYTYSIGATNSAGNAAPSSQKAFCTLDTGSNKTPVYHFEFNGNTQDKNDPTLAFQNPNPLGFVDNNTAIRLDQHPQSIILPFLPQGSELRTVAIRMMFESPVQGDVFSYGAATTNQSFGYTQTSATNASHYYWGSNDVLFSNNLSAGVYYNMIFVFDGMDVRVYRNGNQVATGSFVPNTLGTTFRIGRTTTGLGGYFNGRIDDLRIYNVALQSGEVSSLNAALSKEEFNTNLEFSLYPNPAKNNINIDLETEIKSIEIYSLQGQKVLSTQSKQVDVSNLSNGIYMVRVEDIDGAVSTQKLIKK